MTQPTKLNYITCHFGVPGSWAAGYHTGIDYRAPVGTEIYATKGGRVIHAGWGGKYGPAYGNYVVIQSFYKGRRIQHLYAHLSTSKVRVGSKIHTGFLVGISGDTGNTNGPHLHYEERVFPFKYANHRRPIFPNWKPKNRKFFQIILNRINR